MRPPIRTLDIGFAIAGLLISAFAVFLGNEQVLAVGGTFLLLGTSSFVVIGSLETFTGAAIGADSEIDQDTGWPIGKLENILIMVGEWTALSIVFATIVVRPTREYLQWKPHPLSGRYARELHRYRGRGAGDRFVAVTGLTECGLLVAVDPLRPSRNAR